MIFWVDTLSVLIRSIFHGVENPCYLWMSIAKTNGIPGWQKGGAKPAAVFYWGCNQPNWILRAGLKQENAACCKKPHTLQRSSIDRKDMTNLSWSFSPHSWCFKQSVCIVFHDSRVRVFCQGKSSGLTVGGFCPVHHSWLCSNCQTGLLRLPTWLHWSLLPGLTYVSKIPLTDYGCSDYNML